MFAKSVNKLNCGDEQFSKADALRFLTSPRATGVKIVKYGQYLVSPSFAAVVIVAVLGSLSSRFFPGGKNRDTKIS